MDKQKILITTAIDYCNGVIHIGHAYQKILADALARHLRKIYGKDNVYFTTGTDEYGTTNEKAAQERGLTPKEHVDEISTQNKEQLDSLNISYDRFIRTTDPDHAPFAQEFFTKAQAAGDVYTDSYTGFYCAGCEEYKTNSELDENSQCPLHPTREIQKLEENNYFFSWSKHADFIRSLLEKKELLIPESRKKDMIGFLDQGLEDKPISRPKDKVSWGIPVPGDDNQVIYVWFDALVNYYTAAKPNGFWEDDTRIIHVLGKDNAVFHALLWPAMLHSVGYRQPDTVYAHGFLTLDGQKISKSRGNIIRPTELVEKYSADAVRYYFLKHGPIVEDVNVSIEHFEEVYTADLANGLGNLVARVAKLLEKAGYKSSEDTASAYERSSELQNAWNRYRVDIAIQLVWERIRALDKYLDDTKPWEFFKREPLPSYDNIWQHLLTEIRTIGVLVEPFIPETAHKVQQQFSKTPIHTSDVLFPRLQQ